MQRLSGVLLAALLLAPAPAMAAWDDPNVAGAHPYRQVAFPPQARVAEYRQRDGYSATMLIDYHAGEDDPAVFDEVEGRVFRYGFEHRPGTALADVCAAHAAALRAAGFQTVLAGALKDFPEAIDGRDEDCFGYWRREDPGVGMVWISLHADCRTAMPRARAR